MKLFWAIKNRLYEGLLWSFKESEPYFFSFGIAVLIGVLGFYFLNSGIIAENAYENFHLRLLSGAVVIPLILYKYWPSNLDKYKLWYWYFVLIYTLPFFFSFMLLMNSSSNIWHINGIICFIVLALFVDWLSFLALLFVGVVSGTILYAFTKTTPNPFIPQELHPVLYSYIGPIIYIVLFSRKKEKIQQDRINTMKLVAGSIAHELRTPLSAMMMGTQALSKLLPYCNKAYAKAVDHQLSIEELTIDQQRYLNELPQNLKRVTQNAHTTISMLLTNLTTENTVKKVEICSMVKCIEETLNDYPFSEDERKLVLWDQTVHSDFKFYGHKMLMKHVLFNLIKNSLYAIASAGKGEISINLKVDSFRNDRSHLVFKDTGQGISSEALRHIFDRFYTKKEHGTGIGLAFCKATIEGFGGKISCNSKEGEHTTFTITLPIIKQDRIAA